MRHGASDRPSLKIVAFICVSHEKRPWIHEAWVLNPRQISRFEHY